MAGVPCDARRQGRAAELAALPAVAALRQPRRVGSRSALRAPTPPPALLGCADSPHHPAARRLNARRCTLGGSSGEACGGLCLAAVGGAVHRHGGRHLPVSAQGIRAKVLLVEFRRFRRGERRPRAVRGRQPRSPGLCFGDRAPACCAGDGRPSYRRGVRLCLQVRFRLLPVQRA